MAGRIPENILEEILSRINIVEVISEYIPLKKAGRNFRALCPFHHEKSPSFMVSPDRQIFHCFGCGESGNAFKFLMRYERMDFPEAVSLLARKAGIVLPESSKEDPRAVSLSTQLFKINELALGFYTGLLASAQGAAAKKYLLQRGLTEETIKSFRLGWAPDKWDALIEFLRSKGVGLSLMEKAGLVLPKQNGGYYDRFRQRIIFPIFDIKSRVLGFGGRVMHSSDNQLAKYVNSPETPVYTKGRNLFGLNLAKEAIRQSDCAAVVEGYLDFIIPYQQGVQNLVASQGTALTEEQARLLKRYTRNVVMVYDADNAGQMAALRSLDIFIEESMEVKIVSLPQGFDPDTFVRQKGAQELKNMIENAEGLFDYKFRILKSRFNASTPEGKARISSEMLSTIGRFKDAVLKAEYLKILAQQLDVPEYSLREELGKLKDNRPQPADSPLVKKTETVINPTERLLIKIMMEETRLVDYIRQHLEPSDFQGEVTSRIVSFMFELIQQGKQIEANTLMNHFEDKDAMRCICESVFDGEVTQENREKVVDDCIRMIKNKRMVVTRQRLQEQMRRAEVSGDEVNLLRLRDEFCSLLKRSKE
ncbi:MAG: DNA primase [Candidatus Omnitrophica bacterium]|nr:DNA primase [Candidatus Omnitrophota bacterium]